MSTTLATFTTTHRVIMRVHNDTTVVRTTSEPTATSCLTGRLQRMIAVTNTTYSCLASTEDFASLTRGQLDNAIAAFTRSELSEVSCRTHEECTLSRTKLDVVDDGTNGDVLQRKSITNFRSSFSARHQRLTDLQSVGSNNITFFAVSVEEESDASRTIRIVLNRLHDSGNTIFLSLKVDKAIFLLVTATHIADSHLTNIVTAAGRALAVDERLLRYRSSNLFEGTYNLVSLARCCGL